MNVHELKGRERDAYMSIFARIRTVVKNCESKISDFKMKLDRNPERCIYAIEHFSSKAIESELLLEKMAELTYYIMENDGFNPKHFQNIIDKTIKNQMSDLDCNCFRPNSTNDIANAVNIRRGFATTKMLEICKELQWDLDRFNGKTEDDE